MVCPSCISQNVLFPGPGLPSLPFLISCSITKQKKTSITFIISSNLLRGRRVSLGNQVLSSLFPRSRRCPVTCTPV